MKDQFYFNQVTINREENPGKLLDFNQKSDNVLLLYVDGRKDCKMSSISLTKKNIPFPKHIKWDLFNHSYHNITLRIETVNSQGKTDKKFWLKLNPLCNNSLYYVIPDDTEKVMIICYHENVIGKVATLTVTAKN